MMTANDDESPAGQPQNTTGRRLLLWVAPLCFLACTAVACTMAAPPPTAHADAPTVVASPIVPSLAAPSAPPSPTAVIIPTASAPASGLVVTVLATDVALWQAPDTRSGNVTVSFRLNGNPIQTSIYVNGEAPVLETNVVGTDGKTRWTRVRYSGYAGPLEGGTSFTVTGYLRNDLISAPHAPGAPAVRNP